MRNLIIVVLFALLPGIAISQTKYIKSFYDKYKHHENVQDVKLQGWVLKLASSFSDESTATRILNNISYLRVLIMDNGNLVGKKDYQKLLQSVRQDQFEELIRVKEKDKNIEFFIREDAEAISDVLILVNSADNFVLLSLEGRLHFSDLNQLNIEVDGAEHFKKLPKDKKDLPRA